MRMEQERKAEGMRLKELREKAGLSAADLSRETGASEAAISLWESNERNADGMKVRTALKIARALGVSVEDLMSDAGTPIASEHRPKGLKAIRESRGMTQSQLAKKSGISRSRIGDFESSEKTLQSTSAKKIFALANALDCDTRDIFQDEYLMYELSAPVDFAVDFASTPPEWRELEKEHEAIVSGALAEAAGEGDEPVEPRKAKRKPRKWRKPDKAE